MKAVIFDMDGVLIDSEPLWKIAEIEGFGKVGLDLTDTDCEETVGLRIDEVVKMWHAKVRWDSKTLKEVEMDIVNILIQNIKTQGKALDGVYTTLKQIQSSGLKIGLATSSSRRVIDAVLQKLEINSFFQVTHSAEFEPYGKPHPAVFLTTAQKLAIDPMDCLVVEDSLNGVIAAKASRMKVVAIPEKTHQFDERLQVADKILPSLNHFNLKELNKIWG